MSGTDLSAAELANPMAFGEPDRILRIYRRLRRDEPLARVERPGYRPFWVMTRHADIMAVEGMPELYPAGPRTVLLPEKVETIYERKYGDKNGVKPLTHMDGEHHRKHRAVTQSWFMPKSLNAFSATLSDIAREYVDRMEDMGGQCDFSADIAYWYPLRTVLTLMGVPPEDETRVLRMTQRLLSPADKQLKEQEGATATTRSGDGIRDVVGDFAAYFEALTEDRRKKPRNDLISVIANAEIDGAPMARQEMLSYYIILATAGHDSTAASLGGGLLGLMEFPAEQAKLRASPDLLTLASEEFVRWTAPVKHFMRTPNRNVQWHGITVPAGDAIMLCYPSGCRDETVFADPDTMRVDRPAKPQHLAFGYGVHFCLGRYLANMEIRLFYRELLRRVKSFELAGTPTYVESTFVSGLKSLPVRYRFR